MRKLSLLLLIVALSACNAMQKKDVVKPIEKKEEKSVAATKVLPPSQPAMLDYASIYLKLAASQQKFEFNEILSAMQKDKSNTILRMKLAIMYALPSSRVQDPSKALSIINDLQKSAWVTPDNEQLLALLRDIALASQKEMQKSKEEQKRMDGLQQKNELLLQQNIQLEQKLEALKRIEKTMVDRDQGVKK